MLCITVLVSSTAFAAKAYLIDLGSGSTWTTSGPTSGFTNVIKVNLSTANGGAAVSFNAWFSDRTSATPTYGGGTTFSTGDEVWIAAGTYYLTGTVTLKAGVAIYGGFAGTETTTVGRENSTDKWDFTNATVLDGSVTGTKTYTGLNGASTSTSTTIDGLTIQNCTYNSTAANIGAAATLAGTGYTMQNCIITACTVTGSAQGYCSAGIVMTGGSTFKDSYLHHNTSTASAGTSGGAVVLKATNAKLIGCTLSNNSTAKNGTVYVAGAASGVEISNCNFSSNSGEQGTAIKTYLNNIATTSAMTISNCSFTSNSATTWGGALHLTYTTSGTTPPPLPANNIFNITNCTFTSNYSTQTTSLDSNKGSGAVFLDGSSFSIDKCIFTGNFTAASVGGAILIKSVSSSVISDSKFIGNTAGTTTTNQGSAIYCKSNFTANNCLFADNTGSSVIHFYLSANASTFQNCTFANNMTNASAAAPISLLALTPNYVFSNCLFYQLSTFSTKTPTITNCAFDIAVPAGATNSFTGITAADIVDASNAIVANRDYRLSATSLTIDAGADLSAAASPITKDIIDVNRPQGGAFDIGTYESSAANISGTKNISELTLTPSNNITILSGELTVNHTTEINSIIVAPGAKLTHSSGTLTATNGITLQSDATGTATLMDSYSEPTINATVKQYVTAGRNWYMSAPINNTANASVLDKGVSVQEYNEGSGLWQLATGTLTRGKGYVQVASAGQGTTGTVSFNGTTNSGNVEIVLTNNSGGGKGFNSVGNPYPSYLSWSEVAADNAAANMPTGTMWYRTISYNGKSAWAANTAYSLNDIIYNGTRFYRVVTAGT